MSRTADSFFIDYTGCYRNHVDAELIAGRLIKESYFPVMSPESADLVIFLACGFIDSAREESIERIIELSQEMKEKACLITGGCLFRRNQDELKKELGEVDIWVDGSNPEDFIVAVKSGTDVINRLKYPDIEGKRSRIGSPHTVYVKISEGCMRNCTYCPIPYIRGKQRSRNQENIINEVKSFQDEGVKEILLVAQDSSSYGADNSSDVTMIDLLDSIEAVLYESVRYRLLYIHPLGVSDELLKSLGHYDKILKCLEIPVQHFSDRVLKLMDRKYDSKYLFKMIDRINDIIPDFALRTTFLVGFPGEREEDFNFLISSLKKVNFQRIGVFKYSREEKTKAYNFDGNISEKTLMERIKKIQTLSTNIMLDNDRGRIGSVIPCIIDAYYKNYLIGRSDWDMPEIDKNILIDNKEMNNEIGEWTKVRITDVEKDVIYGILVD